MDSGWDCQVVGDIRCKEATLELQKVSIVFTDKDFIMNYTIDKAKSLS